MINFFNLFLISETLVKVDVQTKGVFNSTTEHNSTTKHSITILFQQNYYD